MIFKEHRFSTYILDPIPEALWRRSRPIKATKLGYCETCKFYHVDPYPSAEYLADFYSSYEMPTSQANLAETARLLARNLKNDSKVIDMGCGDGGFLKEMNALGFDNLVGFDQSPGLERAQKLEFGTFFKKSVWTFLDEIDPKDEVDADAIVMVNVLEHVTEPIQLLERVRGVMRSGALLGITVPNDFSPLQKAFLEAKGHQPWFVHLPDHVNYFDFNSLRNVLKQNGFHVIDQSALYPLELFLLQDLDYVANPELGPVAHQRRVMFEENLKKAGMTDILDHFYETLASGGYGRDVMIVAKKL